MTAQDRREEALLDGVIAMERAMSALLAGHQDAETLEQIARRCNLGQAELVAAYCEHHGPRSVADVEAWIHDRPGSR